MADLTGTLREALAELRAAGLAEVAAAAEARCFATSTTSSEWLGEVGEAVTRVLREHGAVVPPATREKLRRCLAEIAKVWPKYRPF